MANGSATTGLEDLGSRLHISNSNSSSDTAVSDQRMQMPVLNVNLNAPALITFDGSWRNVSDIIDFIKQIEQRAQLMHPYSVEAREADGLFLFKTHLRGGARQYLEIMPMDIRTNFTRIKNAYLKKYKEEKEVRNKETARTQMIEFKQGAIESLREYGKRALRLSYHLERSDGPIFVKIFAKGLRDVHLRRMLFSSPDDLKSMADLHRRIQSISDAEEGPDDEYDEGYYGYETKKDTYGKEKDNGAITKEDVLKLIAEALGESVNADGFAVQAMGRREPLDENPSYGNRVPGFERGGYQDFQEGSGDRGNSQARAG